MRWLLPLCFLSACGVQGPVGVGGGAGGGGVFPSGGGDGTTGGGSGVVITGGGDGTSGGGTGTTGGGDGTTGGGSAVTGGGTGIAVDAGPSPLNWALMSITGASTSGAIIGLGGTHNDVWALQDNGAVFHSTGAAFNKVLQFGYSNAFYASGSTVAIVQNRTILTCTGDCEDGGAYSNLQLLDGGWNYFGETVCGDGPNHVVVVATDTSNDAVLFDWNGSSWSHTNSIGLSYPRSCWFDRNGGLYVSGEGGMVFLEQGASTPFSLGENGNYIYGGVTMDDSTTWAVGSYQFVARGSGTNFTQVPTSGASPSFRAAGGLQSDEVFLLGFYTTTNAIGSGYVWNGTQLKKVGDTLPNMRNGSMVYSILPTASNELFIGGSDGNGPTILRGRR